MLFYSLFLTLIEKKISRKNISEGVKVKKSRLAKTTEVYYNIIMVASESIGYKIKIKKYKKK